MRNERGWAACQDEKYYIRVHIKNHEYHPFQRDTSRLGAHYPRRGAAFSLSSSPPLSLSHSPSLALSRTLSLSPSLTLRPCRETPASRPGMPVCVHRARYVCVYSCRCVSIARYMRIPACLRCSTVLAGVARARVGVSVCVLCIIVVCQGRVCMSGCVEQCGVDRSYA